MQLPMKTFAHPVLVTALATKLGSGFVLLARPSGPPVSQVAKQLITRAFSPVLNPKPETLNPKP